MVDIEQNHKEKEARWRTIKFLPDAPLDENHFDSEKSEFFNEDDAPRCEAVADQLARQLVDFIHTAKYASATKLIKTNPPRIGVFGGLGQGKTTVIRWALWKTEQQLKKSSNWQRTRAVKWFDAAFYNSDELENEFDRLLGSIAPSTLKGKLRSILAYVAITLLVVIVCLLLPEDVLKNTTLIKLLPFFGVGAIIASLLKPWGYWWRDGQRNMTLGTSFWWLQGYKIIRDSIQVLVVDNLDRANLQQQRAILRAIYKHHDQLGYAIIIGFDETPLLAANNDPESPRELLRKSIHVEARMPIRVLTDTLRLAWMASSQAANINTSLVFLNDSRAVAALARIMELLAPLQAVGPRVAKHMVNNGLFFLAHVQKQEQPTLDDWRAVLRLLALYTALPQLRFEGDALKLALQDNTLDSFASVRNLLFTENYSKKNMLVGELAEQIFNATRSYNPNDSDWGPWVVLWETRVFAEESFSVDQEYTVLENDSSKIPDFDSVNFLIDGLLRLVRGKPRTELANITNLLLALPDSQSSSETKIVEQNVASAFLPLVAVLLIQLKQPLERERLLIELWLATDEGLFDWVFRYTNKSNFLIGLAELILIEEKPWSVSSQEVFNTWWKCLIKPDLNISSTRKTRLLSLLPASTFHLAEVMAYAALIENDAQHDLAAENWLVSYNLNIEPDIFLQLMEDPIAQFLKKGVGSAEVKQFWPAIQTKNASFPKLLMEHCIAWRSLNLQGGAQQTPIEYLLLEDYTFIDWIQPEKLESVLPALGQLFFDGILWRSKNWLGLLEYSVKTKGDSTTASPLQALHTFALRYSLLWQKPAKDQFNLLIQIIVASSFPKRQPLNLLAQKLEVPLSAEITTVVIDNMRWWVAFSAKAWKVKHPQDVVSEAAYGEGLIQSWVTGLSSDAWNKLFGSESGKRIVPEDWKKLYLDRSDRKI